MLGNVLGVLVALFGLFGVGAVVCAIVWVLFAWSGRWYNWLLSFVTPLGLASITTFMGWLLGWWGSSALSASEPATPSAGLARRWVKLR
jgi:hypothetical protein